MKRNLFYFSVCLLCFCFVALGTNLQRSHAVEDPNPKSNQKHDLGIPNRVHSRSFRFHYAVTINELEPAAKVRIWIPLAESDKQQNVKILKIDLPESHRKTKEKKYGNRILYFEATADERGEIPLEVVYEVSRSQVNSQNSPKIDDKDRKRFLEKNELVPLEGKPFEILLSGIKPMGVVQDIARVLYDKVDAHVKYDKPPGGKWGRGDATWVCDSKYGNCTDFHSLFISLCRTSEIPARFEIGFPIPTKKGDGKVGGYHCWAYYADGKSWIPVDISEADKHPEMKEFYFGNLTADRVTFSTGRDLVLEPKQKSGPINYFVYPHVEVDGKVHNNFEKRFRYSDISSDLRKPLPSVASTLR